MRYIAWYLTDHLGTVRDVVNSSGSVIDHISYSAYGKVTAESQTSVGDRFKFTGREYDAEVAQYYFRSRFYDPTSGRFYSADSASFGAGDANLFRYVGNSPSIWIDPSGMQREGGSANPNIGNALTYDEYWQAFGQFAREYCASTGPFGCALYPSEARNQAGRMLREFESLYGSPPVPPPPPTPPKEYPSISPVPLVPIDINWWCSQGMNMVIGSFGGFAGSACIGKPPQSGPVTLSCTKKPTTPCEGIYEFPDATNGGKPYVGQSKNVPARLVQHENAGRLPEGIVPKASEVPGGRTAREIAEHQRIQELTGGVPARRSDEVANQRDPIGPNRKHLLGEHPQ